MPADGPADAVHVHRHLGVLQCTGVNVQFVRMGFGIRQTDGTGRILGTGHVLFDFLLILVRTLAHRYRGLTRHDLHLRIGPTPDGLRVDDRVPGHAGRVHRGQQQLAGILIRRHAGTSDVDNRTILNFAQHILGGSGHLDDVRAGQQQNHHTKQHGECTDEMAFRTSGRIGPSTADSTR